MCCPYVLALTCHVHGQSRGLANEKEDGTVECEGADAVEEEDEEVGLPEVGAGGAEQQRHLDEEPGQREEDEAGGGDVVQAGDGVQGHALGSQKHLLEAWAEEWQKNGWGNQEECA